MRPCDHTHFTHHQDLYLFFISNTQLNLCHQVPESNLCFIITVAMRFWIDLLLSHKEKSQALLQHFYLKKLNMWNVIHVSGKICALEQWHNNKRLIAFWFCLKPTPQEEISCLILESYSKVHGTETHKH